MLRKFADAIAPALLAALVLAFLLPSLLYAGGAAATGLPYGIFFLIAFVLVTVVTALLASLYALLPLKFDLRLLYVALALAIAVKAVLMPSAVPLLDGDAKFAPGSSLTGLLSLGGLLASLLIGTVVAWRFALRFVGLATVVVMALGLQPLLDSNVRHDLLGAPKHDASAFFQFAANQPNVLVILLDTFQSDAFAEVVENDASLRNSFDGFTYFYNTTSRAPYTLMALMPVYSGRTYEGGSIRAFYNTASTDSVFSDFGHQNYATSVGGHFFFDCPASACFQRWDLYGDPPVASSMTHYLEVFDVSLLRVVPTFLQPWLYNSGEGRLQRLIQLPDRSGVAESSIAAMEALAHTMNASGRQPTFKFFHIMAMHSPITLNASCEQIQEQPLSRSAYVNQARCVVRTLTEILDALRERGIYDNTTVVAMADHGASISGHAPNKRLLGEVLPHAAST